MKYDAAEILQRLYDSEINFQIETFYDNGFIGRLGDWSNGTSASFCADTLKELSIKLANMAIAHYPESEFGKWWGKLNDALVDEIEFAHGISSVRAINALRVSDIFYIKDLINLTEREIIGIPNLGKKTRYYLFEWMRNNNLKLKKEDDEQD
jgi:DNA-directed RNA polymerase alpha subunit